MKIKTGIVMMNMGGPSHPSETGAFLKRLFQDSDIIDLGGGTIQKYLGNFIATMRTKRIAAQYEKIGGSPIRKWTDVQGKKLATLMDELRPESAPHKAYTAFRYADPLTDAALLEMKKDGVERAIAFSQFPQWSCTTTGSSLNELWREVKRLGLENTFSWSIIDRYPTNAMYVDSICERILEKLKINEDKGGPASFAKPVLVFSAHSVPMKVVEKGDTYTGEVAATVKAVMDRLQLHYKLSLKHVLSWQSKVGYLPWMVPSTSNAIKQLGKSGNKNLLVVPVAFTSDHIETLFELNMEARHEAQEAGVERFEVTEGLNGSDKFVAALADVLRNHLDSDTNYSPQYKQKCLTCTNPACRGILSPAL